MGSGKNWTKEEIAYLDDAWGRKTLQKISETLGRSKTAITLKASRLGFGRWIDGDGVMTYGQLAQALGLGQSWSWHKKRLVANGLPLRKKRGRIKAIDKIRLDEFWQWAETHKNLINWSKVEENILGAEPSWVAERRKIDFYNYSDYNKKWSAAEEDSLRHYVSKGMTYEEIGARLNRTADAIRTRCYDMYLKYPKRVPAKRWTTEEKKLLLELRSQGYRTKHIAHQLGRSEHSVRGQMGHLLHPEYRIKYKKKKVE